MSDKNKPVSYKVPLREQLQSVPPDARMILNDADKLGTRFMPVGRMCHDAAEQIAALEKENANLRTVMIAAAETIHEHWEAHCDAEGYGPANLMHRLEKGIATEYGYTAGAFKEQRKRIAALEAAAREAREALDVASSCIDGYYVPTGKRCLPEVESAIAALDQALGEKT